MRVQFNNPRVTSAIIAGLIELTAIFALIIGLNPDLRHQAAQTLVAVDMTAPKLPADPVKPQPKLRADKAAPGKAAPANVVSKATAVLAAPAIVIQPRLITAATIPNQGNQNQSGASVLPGAGTGAGGVGNGNGSGDTGTGDGDDGDPVEWTGGRIKDSDYPRNARDTRAQGTTTAEVAVGTDGHPKSCRIARSSGFAQLDETTCRLILARYRFRPASDRSGRKIADTVLMDHEWVLGRELAD